MGYSLPLDSQNELFLAIEEQRYGTCIDERSLQLVNMIDFLNKSDSHIIIINNGMKYGDRRDSFEALLYGNVNLYKGEDKRIYIKSKYNTMINFQEYINFFDYDKKIFKLTCDDIDKNFKCLKTFNIFKFKTFKLTTYTIEEYDNLMI